MSASRCTIGRALGIVSLIGARESTEYRVRSYERHLECVESKRDQFRPGGGAGEAAIAQGGENRTCGDIGSIRDGSAAAFGGQSDQTLRGIDGPAQAVHRDDEIGGKDGDG